MRILLDEVGFCKDFATSDILGWAKNLLRGNGIRQSLIHKEMPVTSPPDNSLELARGLVVAAVVGVQAVVGDGEMTVVKELEVPVNGELDVSVVWAIPSQL